MAFIQKIKNMLGMAPVEPTIPLSEKQNRSFDSVLNHAIPEIPFELVKKGVPPATAMRIELTRFMVEKLRPYQNESAIALTGLRLLIVCPDAENQELYRVALWEKQPRRFQDDLDRHLSDNYITLPANWQFEFNFFAETLPECTYRQGPLGLLVLDQKVHQGPALVAKLYTVNGQTEQPSYKLDPADKSSFCIGRGRSVQLPFGRKRTNDIAFLNEDDPGFDSQQGSSNGSVSRLHATIQYNSTRQQYYLKVDQGGLPVNGNKTKILRPDDRVERADVAGMAYPLQHEDQIELGGAAKLLFSLD